MPYEDSYGRRCRTPCAGTRTGMARSRTERVQQAIEKIRLLREDMRISQSGLKSYAGTRQGNLVLRLCSRRTSACYVAGMYVGEHFVSAESQHVVTLGRHTWIISGHFGLVMD
jgi:hypothetical protein